MSRATPRDWELIKLLAQSQSISPGGRQRVAIARTILELSRRSSSDNLFHNPDMREGWPPSIPQIFTWKGKPIEEVPIEDTGDCDVEIQRWLREGKISANEAAALRARLYKTKPVTGGEDVEGALKTVRRAVAQYEQQQERTDTCGIWLFLYQWRALLAALQPSPQQTGEVERLFADLREECPSLRAQRLLNELAAALSSTDTQM